MYHIPVAGSNIEYFKEAKKISKASNLIRVSTEGIHFLFEICLGRLTALGINCLRWLTLSVAKGVFCNPTLIDVGYEIGSMKIDKFTLLLAAR